MMLAPTQNCPSCRRNADPIPICKNPALVTVHKVWFARDSIVSNIGKLSTENGGIPVDIALRITRCTASAHWLIIAQIVRRGC